MSAANRPVVIEERLEDRWAMTIKDSWQKSVEGILETGRHLIQAKEALPHGAFEIMVKVQLPFGARMAQMLMAIARSPVGQIEQDSSRYLLSNANHGAFLPQHWRTLYDLSKLNQEELEAAFSRRLIKPELQRKDIPELVANVRRALGKRVVTKKKVVIPLESIEYLHTFTKQPGWKPSHTVIAADLLEKLPEDERSSAAALVDQRGIPPVDAIEILENLGEKKTEDRSRIYTLAKSNYEHERSRALTEAAKRPPMPDGRIALLKDARKELVRAKKVRPDDDVNNTRIAVAISSIDEVLGELT